jgi:hypothetical protein
MVAERPALALESGVVPPVREKVVRDRWPVDGWTDSLDVVVIMPYSERGLPGS